MNEPRCACVAPDARECIQLRYQNRDRERFSEMDDWETCECVCHVTEWDDKNAPPPREMSE